MAVGCAVRKRLIYLHGLINAHTVVNIRSAQTRNKQAELTIF